MGIVLELQRRGTVRAEDLAQTFETSVRTIYRDVQALCETGVPIIALPGTGYALEERYFLPPLQFSPEEATMLLVGVEHVASAFDSQYRQAALLARDKIEAAIGAQRRDDVRALREAFAFVGNDDVDEERLASLRTAILARRKVRMVYYARAGAQRHGAERVIWPYRLAHVGSVWYLGAYCELATEIRRFRLERIEQIELLDETFERPKDLTFGPDHEPPREHLVRVRFAPEIARFARERAGTWAESVSDAGDGGLIVETRVRHIDDALPWVLAWGRHATVLEPQALAERIRDEARAILT